MDVLIDLKGHGPIDDDKVEKLAKSFEKFVSDCGKAGLPLYIGAQPQAPPEEVVEPAAADAPKKTPAADAEPKLLLARPVKAEKPEDEKPAEPKPEEPKPEPAPAHVSRSHHGTTH